jgi:hypothetical protein
MHSRYITGGEASCRNPAHSGHPQMLYSVLIPDEPGERLIAAVYAAWMMW